MADGISREQFLHLMSSWGEAGSLELTVSVLDEMGWGKKLEFSKQDITTVMQGITRRALKLVDTPGAIPGTDEKARAHMKAMLQAVDQHALPLMKEHA